MILKLKKLNLRFERGTRHWLNDHWVTGCSSISGLYSDDGWKFAWPPKLMAEKLKEHLSSGTVICEEHIDKAKNAWREKRDKAADTGTLAHEAIERYIKLKISGMDVPVLTTISDPEVENAAAQFLIWEEEYRPVWIASELQVGSETHDFAGILDALAEIDGKLVLLDFKTSASIKEEYNIQLAGLQICLEEMGCTPEIRAILHLPKKGEFEYKVLSTDLEFEKKCFLAGLAHSQLKNIFMAKSK